MTRRLKPTMKVHYYPETDSLYIELKSTASVESHEVSDGLVVDLDKAGAAVGLEIEHLSYFTMNSGAEVGLEIHRRDPTVDGSVSAFGVDVEALRCFVDSLAIQESVGGSVRQSA